MMRLRAVLTAAVATVALAVAVAGCVSSPASPDSHVPASPVITADTTRTTPNMVKYVDPFAPAVITTALDAAGGDISTPRFTLHVPPGALAARTTFTLTEQNYRGMEITVEPTGLTFASPATLTFHYAGTSADPSSPSYSGGGALTAAWFDANASAWTAIGGTDDPGSLTFSVALGHLSYYALAK